MSARLTTLKMMPVVFGVGSYVLVSVTDSVPTTMSRPKAMASRTTAWPRCLAPRRSFTSF